MKTIAEYQGRLLSHVEALYRPGERALAIALAEALGCAITDTGFQSAAGETFLAAHPNPDDRNVQNNAFYMSPMTPDQEALERDLLRLSAEDAGLGASLARYRGAARSQPFGIAHFALRYRSVRDVEAVVERIDRLLAPTLGDRLNLRIFRPQDADAAVGDLIQAFVYQDVIVSGSFLQGQLIELQTQADG